MFDYDENALSSEKTSTFFVALGCFWGVEAEYGAIDGVVRTSCGYAGGVKPNPSYGEIKDHTESVRVEYDRKKVSYKSLVEKSLDIHNPQNRIKNQQYDNIIFYRDSKEKRIAEKVLEDRGYKIGDIETRLELITDYYYAEDYHQKYNLRFNRRLEELFNAEYSDEELRNSAFATKVNAFVGGKMDKDDIPDVDEPKFNVFNQIANRFR